MVETVGMKNWKGLRVYLFGTRSYIYAKRDGSCGLNDEGDLCMADKAKAASVLASMTFDDLVAECEAQEKRAAEYRKEAAAKAYGKKLAKQAKKLEKATVAFVHFGNGDKYEVFNTDLVGYADLNEFVSVCVAKYMANARGGIVSVEQVA